MTVTRAGLTHAYKWAAIIGLTGWLFHRTLARLFDRWWNDPTYAHGLLVPLVSAFFLYQNLRGVKASKRGGAVTGAAGLVMAALVLFAGRLGNMLFAEAIAFIAALAALVLLAEGWSVLSRSAAPLAYLVFACPLPSVLYDSASAKLRLLASAASTAFLQFAGVPATSSGNIIYIPGSVLSVEDACSGIRSLLGIIATATAFSFIIKGGFLRKMLLVLSSVPIAVFTNILRVTGTGILQNGGHKDLAAGFYHQMEGWIFYVIALAALFVEYAVLNAVFPIVAGKDHAQEDVGVAGDASEETVA
jgi:exosortase